MKRRARIFLVFLALAALIAVALFSFLHDYNKSLSKECMRPAYNVWIGAPEGNRPSQDVCEGKKIVNLRVGEYRLGDVIFRIPRDYLWQEKFKDGTVDALYILLDYPSLSPIIDSEMKSDSISILIKKCLEDCNQHNEYHLRTRILKGSKTPSEPSEFGLKKYSLKQSTNSNYNIYYDGDAKSPQYCIVCKTEVPVELCRAGYVLNSNLEVELLYNRKLFPKQAEIRNSVSNKINSFIIKGN